MLSCEQAQQESSLQRSTDGVEDGEKPEEQPVLLPVSITDHENGTYVVNYTAPSPGKVSVSVLLDAHDGTPAQHIRGSPFTATFVEKPRPRANEFVGPTITSFVTNTMNLLEKFCLRTESGLQAS